MITNVWTRTFYIGKLTEGDGQDVGTETLKFEDAQSIGIDAEQLYHALAIRQRYRACVSASQALRSISASASSSPKTTSAQE